MHVRNRAAGGLQDQVAPGELHSQHTRRTCHRMGSQPVAGKGVHALGCRTPPRHWRARLAATWSQQTGPAVPGPPHLCRQTTRKRSPYVAVVATVTVTSAPPSSLTSTQRCSSSVLNCAPHTFEHQHAARGPTSPPPQLAQTCQASPSMLLIRLAYPQADGQYRAYLAPLHAAGKRPCHGLK